MGRKNKRRSLACKVSTSKTGKRSTKDSQLSKRKNMLMLLEVIIFVKYRFGAKRFNISKRVV
jgi:hypothetical protein